MSSNLIKHPVIAGRVPSAFVFLHHFNFPVKPRLARDFYIANERPMIRSYLKERGQIRGKTVAVAVNNETAIKKLAMSRWKAMSLEEKSEYMEAERQDKQRYLTELREKRIPVPPTVAYAKFFQFGCEMHSILKNRHPTATSQQILQLVSREWSRLPVDRRRQFHDASRMDRERYRADVASAPSYVRRGLTVKRACQHDKSWKYFRKISEQKMSNNEIVPGFDDMDPKSIQRSMDRPKCAFRNAYQYFYVEFVNRFVRVTGKKSRRKLVSIQRGDHAEEIRTNLPSKPLINANFSAGNSAIDENSGKLSAESTGKEPVEQLPFVASNAFHPQEAQEFLYYLQSKLSAENAPYALGALAASKFELLQKASAAPAADLKEFMNALRSVNTNRLAAVTWSSLTEAERAPYQRQYRRGMRLRMNNNSSSRKSKLRVAYLAAVEERGLAAMEVLSFARKLIVERLDDDFIDRINYYYTPSMMLLFGLLLSAQQWVGQPIECWVPAQFNSAWEEYTENYCFVQNTWFLGTTSPIPMHPVQRKISQLSWYQWTPFILGFMAFLFHSPHALWNVLNWMSGINIHGICSEAKEYSELESEDTDSHLESLSAYIRLTLRAYKEGSTPELKRSPSRQCTVTLLNILMKALFVVNGISQLFLMNYIFSGGRRHSNGFWWYKDILMGKDWQTSGTFPRVTMCDFDVRVMGNKQRHTVQCVLLINMFNEKIFFFLWWWILALIVLNLGNFIYWTSVSMNQAERVNFIRRFLGEINEDASAVQVSNELRVQRRFALRYLRQDGVLIFRKLSYHAGDILAAKVLRCLYSWYREEIMLETRQLSAAHPVGRMLASLNNDKKDMDWTEYGEAETKTIEDTPSDEESKSPKFDEIKKREATNFGGGGATMPGKNRRY